MTLQATAVIERMPLSRWTVAVWVVARRASKRFALLKTGTFLHLLSLSDRANRIVQAGLLVFYAQCPNVAESIAGAKVVLFSAIAQCSLRSLKMALIANGVSTNSIQLSGIHNSIHQTRIQLLVTSNM